MSSPRIYIDHPLDVGATLRLDEEASGHLIRVLRLRPKAPLRLFNGDGREYHAVLAQTDKRSAEVEIAAIAREEPEPVIEWALAQGISKGERMDFALQKAVELGINRFIPVITEHTVVRLDADRIPRRIAHWRKVAISACEQSGRCRIPTIDAPQPLNTWAATLPANALTLVLDPLAEQGLNQIETPQRQVCLLIGPEGGLSDAEIHWCRSQGFTGVRLGPRILRTETAPIAALAAMQMLWGDFRA